MPSHRDTARQFPWDRVPTTIAGSFDNVGLTGIAGWTNLATYLVPAARKASINGMAIAAILTGAGPAGSNVRYRALIAALVGVETVLATSMDGVVVGSRCQASCGQAGWILAGESITLQHNPTAAAIVQTVWGGLGLTECLA